MPVIRIGDNRCQQTPPLATCPPLATHVLGSNHIRITTVIRIADKRCHEVPSFAKRYLILAFYPLFRAEHAESVSFSSVPPSPEKRRDKRP
jgi:hypothetical protein